jgi:hypothetical protein
MNRAYSTHSRVPCSRAAILISGLILACLGIQALITVLTPIKTFQTTWPFVNYGMFYGAHREGDAIPNRVILGERQDGSEVLITPDDLGWSNWFYQILASAILNQDRTVVNGFLSQGPGTGHTRWVSLRVVDRPNVFQWSGAVRGAEKELGIIRLEPGQQEER